MRLYKNIKGYIIEQQKGFRVEEGNPQRELSA